MLRGFEVTALESIVAATKRLICMFNTYTGNLACTVMWVFTDPFISRKETLC